MYMWKEEQVPLKYLGLDKSVCYVKAQITTDNFMKFVAFKVASMNIGYFESV